MRWLGLVALVACSGSPSVDGGADSGSDAGSVDAGHDAGAPDTRCVNDGGTVELWLYWTNDLQGAQCLYGECGARALVRPDAVCRAEAIYVDAGCREIRDAGPVGATGGRIDFDCRGLCQPIAPARCCAWLPSGVAAGSCMWTAP